MVDHATKSLASADAVVCPELLRLDQSILQRLMISLAVVVLQVRRQRSAQMFLAHDRRGHGRSSQVSDGHDMDHYATDVAAVVEHLDLPIPITSGQSTGGGEATRFAARHGRDRVAKLVLIGAVPPLMLKTQANP